MSDNEVDFNYVSDWSEIEVYKLTFDYFKHLTTICSGSTLLIVAFLEKLFTKPIWKEGVTYSLISFFISVVVCVIAQVLIIEMASEKKSIERRKTVQYWMTASLLAALLSFLVGIGCLAVFGIQNLSV
jgi:hypothetical protein